MSEKKQESFLPKGKSPVGKVASVLHQALFVVGSKRTTVGDVEISRFGKGIRVSKKRPG